MSMLSTAAIVEALAVHEVIAVDDDDKGNTKTRGSLRVGYHAENEGLTVWEFCRQIM